MRPWYKVLALLCLVLSCFLLVRQTLGRRAGVMDQLDLLVDVRHQIVTEYVEKPDENRMVQEAVRAMVESLKDPYTVYIPPTEMDQFDRAIRGSFSGIGAEVDIDEATKRLLIVSPLEESPAWKAGVLAGDIVMEINGESTEGIKIEDAVSKLTGQEGTTVKLKVRHPSGEEAELTVTRGRINVQTVKGIRRDAQGHWQFMLEESSKIGYIRLTQFTDTTAQHLKAAVDSLLDQGVKGLILDMRFNPGGLLESAVEISDLFLEKGKRVVSVKGRNVAETVYTAKDDDHVSQDIPIVVLVNEASASASEVVSGALIDNGRAQIVGTRTFGKGSVQQVIGLGEGQGALKLTNAYYYLPSGRNIHRREGSNTWGVDPADGFYVPMTPDEITTMMKARREGDVLRKVEEKQDANGTITPGWIREQMHDPQLAAGLEALVGKLNTGDWPKVGKSNAEMLAKQMRHDTLVKQRDMIRERLKEIEAEIRKVENGEPTTQPSAKKTFAPNEMEDVVDKAVEDAVDPAMPAPHGTEESDKEKADMPAEQVPATQPAK
jgi:carboxyl-terminal processing protease